MANRSNGSGEESCGEEGKLRACSIWGAECSFYSGGRWPWSGARVVVVVAVPGLRRGKEWARTIAGVLAKLTHLMVVKTRLGRDGEVDESLQGHGGSRRR